MKPSLYLVGGGHSHLHVIKNFPESLKEDVDITLISPSNYQYYSGMFSGFTEGLYEESDIRIDLRQLCVEKGIIFLEDTLVALDPFSKTILLQNNGVKTFDMLSVNIGSVHEHSSSKNLYKPNFRFPTLVREWRAADSPTIVGGGASAVELALAAQTYRSKEGLTSPVSIWTKSEIFSFHPKHANKIRTILHEAGVQLHEYQQMTQEQAKSFPEHSILYFTGPKAPDLFKQSGLSVDENGYVLVNQSLQSVSHSSIFAVGDNASLEGYPDLAKNGVYAVRQGPVLLQNLERYLYNEDLLPFKPQRTFLSILSTGNKRGFLTYGDLSMEGVIPWKLKNKIDTRFISTYRV
ncbi:FAD-dependent oxidoreductase [Mangrovibacillus cuniculi]|uniref:FAD-dependent oxidoreductase n=1 Tax=Mangrovibacillus cuniculi TaxID=2593652 RepID=A0A7S8HH51_9BACI|nr:FAD-dependent oxidoreductase [Mangrovibacillus cuniculi]QPC48110.1 FAD-dependent oxidoreductase [Mangrovibacillus cuniculi]